MKINKLVDVDLNILSPQKHIRIHEGDVDSVDILIGVSVDDETVDLDGITIKYDATINNYLAEQDADGSVVDDKISIPVTQNMTAMSGLLLIDVRMIQSDQILFTQTICATVEKAVVNGSTYIDLNKITIIQRMNALEEKMDYIEELVENFDTSKLIVSTNRPPSGAPAELDVDLLRVGDTWILSGASIVYKLVEAQYNYQPVSSAEPYHKFTWQPLNERYGVGNTEPPTTVTYQPVVYTINEVQWSWLPVPEYSRGDHYQMLVDGESTYYICKSGTMASTGVCTYIWREEGGGASSGITIINTETVPESAEWGDSIPASYAGNTGKAGEIAYWEGDGYFWGLFNVATDPITGNINYNWVRQADEIDISDLKASIATKMKLAPLNPTAKQIAALSSGQLYGDTANHKGTIKGGQSFYDTDYINNNYYAKAEIDQKGYLTLGTLPIYDGTVIEGKAVNFYGYDGTVLYSYTAQEALALSELPQAPTHEGLTFQGWNRTLAQLQAYVTDYGIGNAGATYITDDGATRLYLEVSEDVPLDYELYVQIANGTLSVEVDGVELGSATGTTSSYVNYTIPFTLPNRGNVRVDLKFTGTGGFHIGQGAIRTRIFGWNSDQNDTLVKVEIGNSAASIGTNAFQYCTSLNSVVIPNSVTSIGGGAFQYCTSLNSVVIPNSVTSIGGGAFQYCTSLNSVVIPNSVTSIGDGAFQNCTSLNSVIIPNSVTSIGDGAFQYCTSLNSVVIPNSVTRIGTYAFQNCASLNSVVIPNSVTSIGGGAFRNCASLNSAVIPNSVTSIGTNAFQNCTSLNSVVIPNSVTRIGTYAFQNCASLNSVVIPNSVTSIDSNAFQNCTSLNSVVIPNSVTSIGGGAFRNCTSLNSVIIPNSVTSIGTYAFQNCTSLNSVVIPNSFTRIGTYAFQNCASLNSVVIPNSVTSIDSNAFQNCTSLNSVVIPNSVTSIGDGAFQNCTLLLFFDLSQYTDPNHLPTFSNSNFLSETPTDQIIYVANQEMLTAFSSTPNISVFADRFQIKEVTP